MCMCDYGNLENPKFLEMQDKAKKLLYCNWHGFGYLLDCALQITGYLVTLLGIGAILAATLELWVVLLFALLGLPSGAVTEALVRKKFKRLDDALIADQRQWSYYAGGSVRTRRVRPGKKSAFIRRGNGCCRKSVRFLRAPTPI